MRRLNIGDFIGRAISIHGNKFSYERVVYFNENIKVKIVCPDHGVFTQTPKNHIGNKQGCPSCYGNKRLTTETFIEKANTVHKNEYNYSNSQYIGNKGKVEIICMTHGSFFQAATRHLSGDGCPTCGGSKRLTTAEYISKAILIHGETYDYSKVDYVNNKSNVEIICRKHGLFLMKGENHIGKQSQGCKKCAVEKRLLTTNQFIEKARLIHGNKYNYDKSSYVRNDIPTIITCGRHGEFTQRPNSHLNGRGCRKCKTSKGELTIMNWLNTNGIKYEYQKKFDDCINVNKLVFDFYIPSMNLLIEFDGDQHKKINKFFGGSNGFKYRIQNDKIKNEYVMMKNIKLLRIQYKELRNKNIENVLKYNFKLIKE